MTPNQILTVYNMPGSNQFGAAHAAHDHRPARRHQGSARAARLVALVARSYEWAIAPTRLPVPSQL